MPPKRRPRRNGAEGAVWRRIVQAVVRRDAGKCHLCGHFGAKSADHLIPVTEGGAPLDMKNLKAAHGYPHPCETCSQAAGKPVYCNEIRQALSVERARRIIEERTGLSLGEGSGRPPAREW